MNTDSVRGGIKSDVTVKRLDTERFLVVSPATAQRRDYHWPCRHLSRDLRVTVTDLTSAESELGIMGPRSRDFLQKLSGVDLSNKACPFGHWVEIEIGYARARALRMTYVGELGWELYLPTEFAAGAFDAIMAQPDSPRPAGFHALHSLRTESAYRHWGHDITDEDDPLGAGRGFAVARDKDFIGRQAVDTLREQPRSRDWYHCSRKTRSHCSTTTSRFTSVIASSVAPPPTATTTLLACGRPQLGRAPGERALRRDVPGTGQVQGGGCRRAGSCTAVAATVLWSQTGAGPAMIADGAK